MSDHAPRSPLSPLEIPAKLAFLGLLIAAMFITMRTHSTWWLAGYGFCFIASINAIIHYRMPNERAFYLLICDVIFLVLTILSFDSFSVWWPISQVVFAGFVAGGLQNQMDEQTKTSESAADTSEKTASADTDADIACDPMEETYAERGALDALKAKMVMMARHSNKEEAMAYIRKNSRNKMYKRALEELIKSAAEDGDMEHLYTAGYFCFLDATIHNSAENLVYGLRMIAAAANEHVYSAELQIATMYHKLHNEFTTKAEKEALWQMLRGISDVCKPEECYRRQSHNF